MTPDNVYGSTDKGLMRDNNEDAFLAQTTDRRYILAAVIDGVGGYEGGEIAAEIARQTLLDALKKIGTDPVLQLKKSFILANEKIYKHRLTHPDTSNMACVLTAVLADPESNQLYYAHVGDTRLYLLRDHSLVKLSKDHSFVGFLEDNQKISEQEAMTHPKRNEVNKALGYDPNMAATVDYIETGNSPFLPGDLLMLCSDGLTDLVDARSMSEILSGSGSLKEKTRTLIDAANAAGGKDNITVVLVHNNRTPAKQKATRPVAVKKNETPLIESAVVTVPTTGSRKKTNWPAILFFILSVLLAAALYYFWQKDPAAKNDAGEIILPQRNGEEQRLNDSIQANNMVILDSSYPARILINDTIFIQKDSLVIRGNGKVLQADTSYSGPLFHIASPSKYILLEDLEINGFDPAVLAGSRILHLKNVRFVHARVPVQYFFTNTGSKPLTGRLVDSLIFKPDTLSNQYP